MSAQEDCVLLLTTKKKCIKIRLLNLLLSGAWARRTALSTQTLITKAQTQNRAVLLFRQRKKKKNDNDNEPRTALHCDRMTNPIHSHLLLRRTDRHDQTVYDVPMVSPQQEFRLLRPA